MDCWDILGIAPESDKKTIKLAYAKRLKQHRPEEDPEGFQRLHQAYKSALRWVPIEPTDNDIPWLDKQSSIQEEARISVVVEGAKAPFILNPAHTKKLLNADEGAVLHETVIKPLASDKESSEHHALASGLSVEDQDLLEAIHYQEQQLSEDWECLYQQLAELINSPKTVNQVEAWHFLENIPSMADLEFRKAASDTVFEAVAEVNEAALQKSSLYIQRPVINYLNQQLGWDRKWQQYEFEYPRSLLDAVFPYLAEAERPVKGMSKKRELYYYRRGAAFAIDIGVLFVTALLLDGALEWWGVESLRFNSVMSWVGFYLFILVPVQESSHYQGTLGKRMMGLQVITARGGKLHFIHALWRSLVTVLCCLAFKVVVWVNIILSWWRSEILQDTLTRSYVTLKPKRR